MMKFIRFLTKSIFALLLGAIAGFVFCVIAARGSEKAPQITEQEILLIQKAKNCNPENSQRWFMGMNFHSDTLFAYFHGPGNGLIENFFGRDAYIFSPLTTVSTTLLFFEKDSIRCEIR